MDKNISLNELLEFMSNCSGDEALDLINRFQQGALTIENIGVEDFE